MIKVIVLSAISILLVTSNIATAKSTTYSNQTSTRTVDYTYDKIVGNKYTVLLDDHVETPYKHDLYKAKPLKMADLDGKIFQLGLTSDSRCFSKTLKIAGNKATLKEDCKNGLSTTPFSLTSSAGIDNGVVFNVTDNGAKYSSTMFLIDGNTSSTATAAFLQKKNNVYKKVSINTLKLTKKEATDTTIPLTPALLANKVFWFEGGNGGYQKVTFSASGDSGIRKESEANQVSEDEFTPTFVNGKMEISGNNGHRDFYMLFTLKSKTDKSWKFKRQDGKNNPTYAVDTWYLSKPAGFPANF